MTITWEEWDFNPRRSIDWVAAFSSGINTVGLQKKTKFILKLNMSCGKLRCLGIFCGGVSSFERWFRSTNGEVYVVFNSLNTCSPLQHSTKSITFLGPQRTFTASVSFVWFSFNFIRLSHLAPHLQLSPSLLTAHSQL